MLGHLAAISLRIPPKRSRGALARTFRAGGRFALGRCALAIVLLQSGFLATPATAAVISEHQVKAAFIYNFTKFVSWPPESFAALSDPIVLGVVGESRVALELSAIVKNRKVEGRELIVKTVASAAEARAAHLLFVPAVEERRFMRMKDELSSSALLVVSDAETCAQMQVSICFIQQGDKLRFTIEPDVSQHSRLKISSHLQKLAANFNK